MNLAPLTAAVPMMDSASTATLSHVSMSYDGVSDVLQDIDISLGRGEFLSIVGPSGCGKSTILRLISGLAAPSRGHITVKAPHGSPANIGFMFQRDALLPWTDVAGNIRVGLDCAGVSKGSQPERVKQILGLLGLENFGAYYPRALSGGMRQRVALGRLLAYDPEVMLMDEPFGALDAQTKILMGYELLRIWTDHRKSVVFVTHDIDEAIALSDRILVMSARPGRIKSEYRVNLPRPRDFRSIRSNPAFHDLSERIWRDIVVDV